MRMVRWMCNVSLKDMKSSQELRDRCGLESIRLSLQRLGWFGHVERLDVDNWVRKSRDIVVDGKSERGRPRKTWAQVIGKDLEEKHLQPMLAQDRLEWRRAIR